MGPEQVASIVTSALSIVSALVPGFLAVFTGNSSDEEAIAKAQAAILAVPVNPAKAGIARWRAAFRG